jgi:hypothetical protein
MVEAVVGEVEVPEEPAAVGQGDAESIWKSVRGSASAEVVVNVTEELGFGIVFTGILRKGYEAIGGSTHDVDFGDARFVGFRRRSLSGDVPAGGRALFLFISHNF